MEKIFLILVHNPPDDCPYYQTWERITPVIYDIGIRCTGLTSSNDASQQSFIDLIIEKDMEQIVDFNTCAIGTLDNVFISKCSKCFH